MKTLRAIFKEEGIHSKKSLSDYIARNRGKKSGIPLIVLDSNNLGLDSESRTYVEDLSHTNTIIDAPILRLRDSQQISFQNCVFTGEVYISRATRVSFDSCVFAKPLKISNLEHSEDISLTFVNAPEIMLFNNKCEKIWISYCRVCHFLLTESKVDEFLTFCNSFEHIEIASNQFEKVSFRHRQVNLFSHSVSPSKSKLKRTMQSFNLFKFDRECNYDEMSDEEVRDIRIQTVEFFATYSDASRNREVASHLKYLQALACQPNWALRQIQRVLGAFVKPGRVLFLIGLVIVFFGFLFTLPFFRFSLSGSAGDVERSLSILEALYFSGISFTTIGYGDITPLAWARVCAVLEGLLGIVLASSLLVSFLRKYLD